MMRFDDSQLKFLYRSFRLLKLKKIKFRNKEDFQLYGKLELRNSLLLALIFVACLFFMYLWNKFLLLILNPSYGLDLVLLLSLFVVLIIGYFVHRYLFIKYLTTLEYSSTFYEDVSNQCDY